MTKVLYSTLSLFNHIIKQQVVSQDLGTIYFLPHFIKAFWTFLKPKMHEKGYLFNHFNFRLKSMLFLSRRGWTLQKMLKFGKNDKWHTVCIIITFISDTCLRHVWHTVCSSLLFLHVSSFYPCICLCSWQRPENIRADNPYLGITFSAKDPDPFLFGRSPYSVIMLAKDPGFF